MDDYTPTNSPQACPTSQNYFRADPTPLPPTPNEELCSCMYNAISCAVNPSTSESDYKKLFSYVCGKYPKACDGIAHDAGTGTYGAYSMCNTTQQLGWAFNLYYNANNKASTACDFNGAAHVQSPSVNDACKALLKQAGGYGTGTVTSSPTVTGAGAAGQASGSSSGGIVSAPKPESGLLPMVFVLVLAAVSGVAAALL